MRDPKTRFRAWREGVGMSQQMLADEMGVSLVSVKRWERPSRRELPPEDAWNVLIDRRLEQYDAVEDALERAEATAEKAGRDPDAFLVPYWHDQEQYEAAHPDGGDFRMMNATARAVESALIHEGFEVEFTDGDPC